MKNIFLILLMLSTTAFGQVDFNATSDGITARVKGGESFTLGQIYWKRFALTSDVTSNLSTIPDLQVDNLTIGKTYHIVGTFRFDLNVNTTADSYAVVALRETLGGDTIISAEVNCPTGTLSCIMVIPLSYTFTAKTNNIYFSTGSMSANSSLRGIASGSLTYFTIFELNGYTETNKW